MCSCTCSSCSCCCTWGKHLTKIEGVHMKCLSIIVIVVCVCVYARNDDDGPDMGKDNDDGEDENGSSNIFQSKRQSLEHNIPCQAEPHRCQSRKAKNPHPWLVCGPSRSGSFAMSSIANVSSTSNEIQANDFFSSPCSRRISKAVPKKQPISESFDESVKGESKKTFFTPTG